VITGDELMRKIESGWKILPPNPTCQREYVCSLEGGRAVLTISAAGGVIPPQDAQDVIDWLELILKTLKRAAEAKSAEPTPQPTQEASDE